MKFTICGSTRFETEFHFWNKKLGLLGHISYSLMTFPSVEGEKTWYTDDEKEILDLAHLAKIEESDAILILNVGGYIGDSTRREVKWARMRGKRIFWLEANEDLVPWEDLAKNISKLIGFKTKLFNKTVEPKEDDII